MSASQRLLCNLTRTLPCIPSSFTFSYSGSFRFIRLRRPYTVTATRPIGLATTSIADSNSIMPPKKQQRGRHIEGTWKYIPKKNGSPSAVGTSVTDEAEAVTNTLVGLSISKSYGTVSGNQTLGAENASIGNGRIQSRGLATDTATAPTSTVGLSKLFRGDFENFKVDNSTYSSAQIRATFYPKFENEKTDQEIRIRMIEMVSRGQANLEVSLKHSGSLFMYAGHDGGAYAKNSFGNIYTAVGVFVLGRTFRETWGAEASKKQAEFNEFLERNRMCISMELVTAVLGDHGQRPCEDYVVVTAVTELGNGKPKFYSTPDIITFCRKWRLPTNHVWLFANRKSATSFFAAYDALCEEGTATTVCKTLDEIADISVPGSKDHIKFQGEILEGLVARIVSQESISHMEKVLTDYPPPPESSDGIDLGPSLREICAANRSNENQQIRALLQNVGNAFCPDYSDWFGADDTDIQSRNVDKSVVVKFLQARPADYSTKKLQEMVRLIREKRYPAAFKFYHNFHKIDSLASDNIFYKMVIHVHSDSAFRRYHSDMRQKPGLWPLYRGFFVDINLFKGKKENDTESSNNDIDIRDSGSNIYGKDGLADEDANLMIKLKFLTYKLRTFLIRNGLSILFKEGPAAYKSYYLKQMKKWGTSAGKQRELSKMLDEWAIHIRRKCGNKQLSSATYLSEVEPFLEQYAKRCPQNRTLIGAAGSLVEAVNFLAISEGGKDVEGDLETERQLAPTSPSRVKGIIPKDEGLIVFFPGIPGCAKSALCRELLNCPDVLGDDRPIHSLMGDLVKGRYWQKVADERKKRPNSILLADKNAPNDEVWSLIEDMCRRTRASAVPVVPDSEGTDSNPFSLDALAVFLFRVLQRVNHPGNLDRESPNAGYVLLMFYHLYEGKSRKEFESELIERFGSLVKMPLLKSDRNPLPYPVQSTLEEGIDLYKLHRSRHGRADSTKGCYAKEWSKWEKQLREVLFSSAEYFNSVQVPFEFAVKQVQEQIRIVAKGEFPTPETEKRKFGAIVFAAVSLPVAEIQVFLRHLAEKNDNVKALLENMQIENLRRAHLTLAHKRSHGIKAVADYGIFLNKKVPVDFTALLFSDKMAAFEASPGSVEGEAVVPKNAWPHVTLWTAEGIAAKEANSLPQFLAEGKATRVDLTPPFTLCGTLEFF